MSLHLNLSLCKITLSFLSTYFTTTAQEIPFSQNYVPLWGGDHVSVINGGKEVQIKMDKSSGGGFRSKQAYSSGVFTIKMKVPKIANGAVATFYLTSIPDNGPGGPHGELDFELLGRNGGTYTLQTNVFAGDNGGRERQFKLWFDPTTAFHEYKILWNQFIIVFFVDGIPITVYKNLTKFGAKYPTQSMSAHGSLWAAEQWLGPVDWSKGPFFANFRGFNINNAPSNYRQLDPREQKLYDAIQKTNTYNYCKGNGSNKYPECKH